MFQLTLMVKRILIANVIIFMFLQGFQTFENFAILTPHGVFREFKLYQLITYQYLHGSFMHIFFNMLILAIFGPALENRWGSKNFLIVYTTAGVFAGLAEIILSGIPNLAIIGASGSIMGIFCAYALYYPDREVYVYLVLPVKIKYLFIFYLAFDVINALSLQANGIANFAHLGGALIGYIFYKYLDSVSKGTYYSGANFSNNYNSSTKINDFFDKVKKTFESKKSSSFKVENKESIFSEDKIAFYRKEMDILLDKINEVGYLHLTVEERNRLEAASNYIKKYDSH